MEATKSPRPRAVYPQTQATAAPTQAYRLPERIVPQDLPSTRYQGSKRRLSAWLHVQFKKLVFDSALDVFSGSGSVAYVLKLMGKKVTTNDFLQANRQTSLAFIVNDDVKLTTEDVDWLTERHHDVTYRDTIARNFGSIFYLDDENCWLDMLAANIQALTSEYSGQELARKRALAYWALFQSCLAKRPFNLFHRANLNLRTADVVRHFWNKVTWDTPFPEHFRKFANEANTRVFSNGLKHAMYCTEASRLPKTGIDLVYLDPPYIPKAKRSPLNSNNEQKRRKTKVQSIPRAQDYWAMYHFLEGLVYYDSWEKWMDHGNATKTSRRKRNPWNTPETLVSLVVRFAHAYPRAKLVLSYKTPGTPSISTLRNAIAACNRVVSQVSTHHSYALNRSNGAGKGHREVLLIGTPQ